MAMTEDQVMQKQFNMQQQQIDNDPQQIYADSMREEKAANLLDQLNPDNLLVDVEHRIRGEKKDPFTQRWVPISKNALEINEDLVSNFMSFLGSILNQNVSMSNFSEKEINNLMRIIIAYVSSDLTTNDVKYGIQGNYTEMTRIANIVCITCFATFKQAMNGTLSRRVFGSLKLDASLTKPDNKNWRESLAFWK